MWTEDTRTLADRLASAADRQNLTMFDMVPIVKDAFRMVQETHLRRIVERFEKKQESLRRERWRNLERGRPKLLGQRTSHVIEEHKEVINMTAKPEKEFRAGTVRATIWENTIEKNGETFNIPGIQIERRYRDKDGEWKTTNSFQKNDLANLGIVVYEAQRYLALKERNPQEEQNGSA